jgi:hypothetical protein
MRDDELRVELLMAAATGERLQPDVATRLERLLADDPTARQELAEISEVLAVLPEHAGWAWDPSAPPPDLEDRILAATKAPTALARSRWRPGLVAACAAGLLALGAAGGWGVAQVENEPPVGPPGTPGAIEPVTFTAEPEGIDIDASVVAHTWGTEAVFDVAGLEPGSRYEVVVVGRDGEELLAGSFLATDGTVVCRMNAAMLRPQATALAIRGPDGEEVLRAELAPVEVSADAEQT